MHKQNKIHCYSTKIKMIENYLNIQENPIERNTHIWQNNLISMRNSALEDLQSDNMEENQIRLWTTQEETELEP